MSTVKPFVTGVTLMALFQGTGYPIFIGSAAEIFGGVLETVDEDLCAVIVGVVVVFGAALSIPLSKAFRCRTLLLTSAAGVTTFQAAMGLYRFFEEQLRD